MPGYPAFFTVLDQLRALTSTLLIFKNETLLPIALFFTGVRLFFTPVLPICEQFPKVNYEKYQRCGNQEVSNNLESFAPPERRFASFGAPVLLNGPFVPFVDVIIDVLSAEPAAATSPKSVAANFDVVVAHFKCCFPAISDFALLKAFQRVPYNVLRKLTSPAQTLVVFDNQRLVSLGLFGGGSSYLRNHHIGFENFWYACFRLNKVFVCLLDVEFRGGSWE